MTTAAAPVYSTLIDVIPRASTRQTRIAREVAIIGGFAVLTALLAQVRFDLAFTPVPITGQTLGVLLAGAALGSWRGALSQCVYWAVGIVMPVAWYANDHTGSSVSAGWKLATGATAGYLFGFVIAAGVVGYLAELGQDRNFVTSVPAMLVGSAIIYTFGVAWLAFDLGIPVSEGESSALALGLTPFVIGDLIKLLLAGSLTPAAWRLFARMK